MWDDLVYECSCVRVYVQQLLRLKRKYRERNGDRFRRTQRRGQKENRPGRKKREREREGDVPPLGPGLKLIGPGLEEIIYKKYRKIYTKPSTGLVSMAIVCCATVQQQQGEKIKPVAALITRKTQLQSSHTRLPNVS